MKAIVLILVALTALRTGTLPLNDAAKDYDIRWCVGSQMLYLRNQGILQELNEDQQKGVFNWLLAECKRTQHE